MDDEVPISVEAWKTEGSRMFVREGTRVRLEDLLRGIIIQSGNDASVAVAEYLSGTEDAFADLMNAQAQALGMTSTVTEIPPVYPLRAISRRLRILRFWRARSFMSTRICIRFTLKKPLPITISNRKTATDCCGVIPALTV